jgi:ZIP family zinc transporter
MIDFASSFAQFILATFIPLYSGMLFVILLRRLDVDIRILSAFALGLLFWFFLDTSNDAIQLGVNEGYSFGFHHAALLLLFVVSFLTLALFGGFAVLVRAGTKHARSSTLLVALLVALGMGFHGIGEGLGFGATAAGTSASSVLDAIGGYGGGIAYVLHKFLEASIVMIVFVALTGNVGMPIRRKLSQIAVVGLAFGIPSVVGEVVGYYAPIDSSYFFALGGGAALFVALQVVRPIFVGDRQMTCSQWVKIVLAVLIGFLSLYAAAAFHAG